MKRIFALWLATGLTVAHAAPKLTSIAANPKAAGYAPAPQLSPELRAGPVAIGAMPLENPEGIVGWYGYENDVAIPGAPALAQMLPVPGSNTEAQKTEPDKNTFLEFWGQSGADPRYDYGTHFLFQGHEAGATVNGVRQGYITRINLDADTTHRVTLLATHDVKGNPLAPIDGSTWDPFAQRLLFTTENAGAPTYAATATFPSEVEDVSGALGRGGYEGIQNDDHGNLWIVEDIGGPFKPGTTARQPNSFVYRYVPARRGDLHHGRLEVLQVLVDGHPVTFESQAGVLAPDQVALRTFGRSFDTRWIPIHDTEIDGTVPFIANPLARAAQGTPFKRPENGVFRPGSNFREFFFDETGDTDATSPENGDPATGAGGAGGWASLFRLWQPSPAADQGTISLFYRGNMAVAGLDNIQFLSRDQLLVGEDAGDKLHGQRGALDSGFLFDVNVDYAGGAQPVRFLAQGRDASATLDSANGGFSKNDGDNEITGIHVSDGNPTVTGILGARVPRLGHEGWRWFYTQQHGDNVTWEITLPRHDRGEDRD